MAGLRWHDWLLSVGQNGCFYSSANKGGLNSQLRAVLRNHRGLTSVKRVKAVFWWCHAHSGDARTAREKLATMPTDADIDFLFSVYSASPSRDDGGPEWGDRAVWEDLHHRDPYPFWLD